MQVAMVDSCVADIFTLCRKRLLRANLSNGLSDFSRHFIRARLVSSSSRPRMECQRKVSSASGLPG